jgi:hypothetical protein
VKNSDISRLTLSDLEAIASRAKAAAETLQSALKLLRLGAADQPAVSENTGGHVPNQTPAPLAPANLNRPTGDTLTPEQRKALSDWRNSSARSKLLEQMQDTKDELPADIQRAETVHG